MHGRLDFHKSKALNALLTTEANEQAGSARHHRFDDWFGELFSVRYVIMVVSGQPMALDLKFQGIRVSISVTGQP